MVPPSPPSVKYHSARPPDFYRCPCSRRRPPCRHRRTTVPHAFHSGAPWVTTRTKCRSPVAAAAGDLPVTTRPPVTAPTSRTRPAARKASRRRREPPDRPRPATAFPEWWWPGYRARDNDFERHDCPSVPGSAADRRTEDLRRTGRADEVTALAGRATAPTFLRDDTLPPRSAFVSSGRQLQQSVPEPGISPEYSHRSRCHRCNEDSPMHPPESSGPDPTEDGPSGHRRFAQPASPLTSTSMVPPSPPSVKYHSARPPDFCRRPCSRRRPPCRYRRTTVPSLSTAERRGWRQGRSAGFRSPRPQAMCRSPPGRR